MKDKTGKFTLVSDRVEQWETHYSIPELNITGVEMHGLIFKLAEEVKRLRDLFDASEEPYNG